MTRATWTSQPTERMKIGDLRGADIKSGPKSSQPYRELPRFVEVSSEQNRSGNEAAFAGADECSGNVEGGAAGDPGLCPC